MITIEQAAEKLEAIHTAFPHSSAREIAKLLMRQNVAITYAEELLNSACNGHTENDSHLYYLLIKARESLTRAHPETT